MNSRYILLFAVILCCLVLAPCGSAQGGGVPNTGGGEIAASLAAGGNQGILILSPGWNFISIPQKLAPGSDTVQEIFRSVDLNGRSIFSWDAARGYWKPVMPGDLIRPLEGFWVYSATPARVQLISDTTSIPFPPSRQLYQGWNAIGVSGVTPFPARDALISLGPAWEVVIGYHDGAAPDEPIRRGSADPRESESRLMVPMQGYWVYLNDDRMYLGML